MPSDMDHLHGTDTRDARIAELRAENERLSKELDVCEYVKRVDDAREEGRKEAAVRAIEMVSNRGYAVTARLMERAFGLTCIDAKPEPKVKIGEGGVVVVAPAGDSPLRELYESPEFRAAWANREEKQ